MEEPALLWLAVVSSGLGRVPRNNEPCLVLTLPGCNASCDSPRWAVRGLPEGWQIRLPHASASCSQWLAQPTYIALRGFIHQGDPQLQQNSAMTLPCLFQKSKCAHRALGRTQGALGKQKREQSSPICVDLGFRETSLLLRRAQSYFSRVFLPNTIQRFLLSHPLRV